jgi:septum formation inhibitor-activating ATPase MinD
MLESKMISVSAIVDCLDATLIGVIPDDDKVSIQMLKGGAFDNNTDIQRSLNIIANNLITGESKIYDCTKKYRGIFGSIRKNIKKRV